LCSPRKPPRRKITWRSARRRSARTTRSAVSIATSRPAGRKSEVAFGPKTRRPADTLSRLFRNDLARAAGAQDIHASIELVGGNEVALHFGGEPVLRPGIAREVSVTVGDDCAPKVELTAPKGWTCERLGPNRFRLESSGAIADRNTLTVKFAGGSAGFTMLGPGEAKGFAAGDNVEMCPECRARIEACICNK
jgi:hypothetical protein